MHVKHLLLARNFVKINQVEINLRLDLPLCYHIIIMYINSQHN